MYLPQSMAQSIVNIPRLDRNKLIIPLTNQATCYVTTGMARFCRYCEQASLFLDIWNIRNMARQLEFFIRLEHVEHIFETHSMAVGQLEH